jgi:hypothetical protein
VKDTTSHNPYDCLTRWSLYASRVKPDDDGGEDQHRAIIERTFFVAGGQSTPLFESVAAALHHVASRIDGCVEKERTSWSSGSLRALVAPLWNGVLDLSLAQHAPTARIARIAVAFVSDEALGTRSRSPTSCGTRNPDAIQHRLQLRTVMAMPWRDHDGQRPSAPVTSEVKLGGQPATTASEPLVGGVADPFFSSARLRRRRAPLAC